MITVKLDYINENLSKIEIKGHANADEYGKDIVCSAVSSCVIGAINNFNTFKKNEISINDGHVIINVNHQIDEHDNIVIETLIRQLETIKETYSKYIKIERKDN